MKGFKVKFRVLEKSIGVLEKSLKFVSEKGKNSVCLRESLKPWAIYADNKSERGPHVALKMPHLFQIHLKSFFRKRNACPAVIIRKACS